MNDSNVEDPLKAKTKKLLHIYTISQTYYIEQKIYAEREKNRLLFISIYLFFVLCFSILFDSLKSQLFKHRNIIHSVRIYPRNAIKKNSKKFSYKK